MKGLIHVDHYKKDKKKNLLADLEEMLRKLQLIETELE